MLGFDPISSYPLDAIAVNYTLTCTSGTYTLTGNNVTFGLGHTLVATSGSYTLTGNDASFISGDILQAETGTFVLTGNDVEFTFTPFAPVQLQLPEQGAGGGSVYSKEYERRKKLKREDEEIMVLINSLFECEV